MAKKKLVGGGPVVYDPKNYGTVPVDAELAGDEKPISVIKTQAEIDAGTLIEAQQIRQDPKRFMAARAVNPNIHA